MRKLILVSVFLFPVFASGQKFELDLEFSPNYSVLNYEVPIPEFRRMPRVGFEAGIRVFYKPGEKFSFYAGAGFSKFNFVGPKTNSIYNVPPPDHFPDYIRYFQSYNYLTIPLGVQYSLGKHFFVGGGLAAHGVLSVYEYSVYYYYDEIFGRHSNFNKKLFFTDSYRPLTLGAQLETGYKVRMFKHDVMWKAGFQYMLVNILKNSSQVKIHPYSFSLGVSVPLWKW